MLKQKGKAMLSIFANTLFASTRQTHWDAPDHFKTTRGPRSNIALEREAAERRLHLNAMRNVGMW